MNKIIRLIQTYLVFAFPLVLACMLWQTLSPDSWKSSDSSIFFHAIKQALCMNLMFWFVMLIVFLCMLVIFPRVREKTLRGLANLKERDEREEYITGKASRAAYISTLSLTIFFLFFSLITFTIYRVPPEQAINGKRTFATISLGFSLQNDKQTENHPPLSREILFSSSHFSLSTSSLLILMLAWQLSIFNFIARKELRE